MKGKYASIVALLALAVLVDISPRIAHANPADLEEIAHMKARQTVEGVGTHMRSGLYTIRSATGTNYTLAESSAVRYSRNVPKVGDEMILWINAGNHILDANKKGSNLSPRFTSGTLVSINYGRSQITLSVGGREESFKLRPREDGRPAFSPSKRSYPNSYN